MAANDDRVALDRLCRDICDIKKEIEAIPQTRATNNVICRLMQAFDRAQIWTERHGYDWIYPVYDGD